jgi:LPPG:FO 2-phospho-L-lactate transferase
MKGRRILALAGGVGGGKLARGLAAMLPPDELTLVVNTADDFVHLGLHICPDIDSVLYALADLNDPERGWGLAGETWNFMAAMERLDGETWFRLGDRDLATHVLRTRELEAGKSLSDVCTIIARRLGIAHQVAPMSEDPVRSIVETDEGTLDFQDYFVRRQCKPAFCGVAFQGAADARPSAIFRKALDEADAIVITPSNPFVSIDPILALPGVRETLRRPGRPIVAVSPIVGGQAVKGPLAKMLRELGREPSAMSVAQHYGPLIDGWIVDNADIESVPAIERLGHQVRVCNTMMHTLDDKRALAQDTLELVLELSAVQVS